MVTGFYRKLLVALSLALAATACGSGGGTTTAGGEGTQQASGVQVAAASSPVGEILTDGSGRTLYMFTQDSPGKSVCYDTCAEKWPPLTAKAKPEAGSGVDASMLGTIERKNGDMQVTYADMPLYYWVKDEAAGDITGQGVGGVWYVVSPSGEPIKKQPPTDGGNGGSGYGGGY